MEEVNYRQYLLNQRSAFSSKKTALLRWKQPTTDKLAEKSMLNNL